MKIELEIRILSSWQGAEQARPKDVDIGTRKELNKSNILKSLNVEVKTILRPGGLIETTSFRDTVGVMRTKSAGRRSFTTRIRLSVDIELRTPKEKGTLTQSGQ
jgi:hypothetical protein